MNLNSGGSAVRKDPENKKPFELCLFFPTKYLVVLVGIYNQQFKGTILFMVFDFQG